MYINDQTQNARYKIVNIPFVKGKYYVLELVLQSLTVWKLEWDNLLSIASYVN